MNRQKPLVLDNREFGETYHVAAALALDENTSAGIVLPDSNFAYPFLRLFADDSRVFRMDRVTYCLFKKSYSNVVKSTDFYNKDRPWSPEEKHHLFSSSLSAIRSKQSEIEQFLGSLKISTPNKPSALIWIRMNERDDWRNSTEKSTEQLVELAKPDFHPILIGNRLGKHQPGEDNLIEYYDRKYCDRMIFDGVNRIALQLLMFDILKRQYDVRFSLGMQSGGMDGPALFLGLDTICVFPWRKEKLCSGKKTRTRLKKIEQATKSFVVVETEEFSGKFADYTSVDRDNIENKIRKLAE